MRGTARPDDGTTLIELLVAMIIIGLAVTAIVGGMHSTVVGSDVNRKQAEIATHITSYAESVKGDAYVDCATPAAYGAGFTTPTGFSKDAVVVAYWNGTTFASTCGADTGMQRVTLSIRSADGRAVSDLQLAKRR